jgi:exopolysaccharide biosynthesis polyprenyl glycosylphosphotransferase
MTLQARAGARSAPVLVVQPRGPLPAPVAPRPRRAPARSYPGCWLLAADLLAVAATAAAAGPAAGLPAGLVVAAVLVALGAGAGLYRPTPMSTALDELPRLLAHAAVAWLTAAALLGDALRPVSRLAALLTAQTLLAAAARALAHHVRRRAARRRPRPALVVGTGPAGQRVAAVLAGHPEYGMRPVGLVGPVPPRLPETAPLPVLPGVRDVERAVVQNGVRHAVFARAPEDALLRLFWASGCTVWRVAADGAAPGGPPARQHLWGFPCHRLDPPGRPGPGRAAKRLVDVVVAGGALLAAAPVMAACALAVRCADGPGVLFRQERIGEDGRPFVILKFRTLRPADEREAATRWTVAREPRMSAVGRLLRRTSLDELPQLWNVLRGDMSLVGPRPERPHFVERFSRAYPGYADRHRMPVGLTGLAQVSGLRGDTSIEDRARFDNLYIDTWSLGQDVRIMLRTTAACFRFGGG